jgi:glycogen operon protein
MPDVFWRKPDGQPPKSEDWQNPGWATLCLEVRTSSETPEYAASDDVLFLTFNAGEEITVTLPDCPRGMTWELVLNTAAPEDGPICMTAHQTQIPADSVCVFSRTKTD